MAYGYYLNDHLGAPQKVVDRSGAVIWQMQSTAFDKTTVAAGARIVNNLRFSSQYFDAETGLHHNTQRYYDPDLGRYLRRDPLGLDGGLNVYAFCGNNHPYGVVRGSSYEQYKYVWSV